MLFPRFLCTFFFFLSFFLLRLLRLLLSFSSFTTPPLHPPPPPFLIWRFNNIEWLLCCKRGHLGHLVQGQTSTATTTLIMTLTKKMTNIFMEERAATRRKGKRIDVEVGKQNHRTEMRYIHTYIHNYVFTYVVRKSRTQVVYHPQHPIYRVAVLLLVPSPTLC